MTRAPRVGAGVMVPVQRSVDLRMPAPERRLAASLAGPWADLLYAPGPGFTSPVDAGLYRASFLIVPGPGAADRGVPGGSGCPEARPAGDGIRLSSQRMPAFGGDLCRLRMEWVAAARPERLGSLFQPERQGLVYAMRDGGLAPADRAEWRYGGPSLAAALGLGAAIYLIRERGRGGSGAEAFAWEADRGLLVIGASGHQALFLAESAEGEQVAFLPALGPYRTLVDRTLPTVPGATLRELLGYGDWEEPLEILVMLVDLSDGATSATPG